VKPTLCQFSSWIFTVGAGRSEDGYSIQRRRSTCFLAVGKIYQVKNFLSGYLRAEGYSFNCSKFCCMPELPEVESFRKFIDKTSLRKTIEVAKLSSPNMLLQIKEKLLIKTLEGNSLEETFRHGKFLFMKLKKGGFLMLHFGLTGDVEYRKPGEEPPSRYALQLHFSDDSDFYFTDTRKMGKIALVDHIDTFIKKRGYGTDALKLKEKDFVEKILKKKVAIKTVLMDQKIVAGVGNEFSDEILFQTKIHPATPTSSLSEKQLKEIWKTMVAILKTAVKANASREKLDQYFFLDNRKAGFDCPRCGGKTAFQSIGGRSSYFCPKCQKKY
jgi:formamidopyrimidine-DNA glycosylase